MKMRCRVTFKDEDFSSLKVTQVKTFRGPNVIGQIASQLVMISQVYLITSRSADCTGVIKVEV